ncbi:C-type lectin domain family 4 member E-like [Polypterus senegalus]|uniref:C-type lectin domain family 4 member E-like n=1 Tax=Polypterus senegalus TaxID=55291 RepID=UPI001966B1F2|nr:C-type lectin domain family 4 member E-like [Polypterus senegalus]
METGSLYTSLDRPTEDTYITAEPAKDRKARHLEVVNLACPKLSANDRITAMDKSCPVRDTLVRGKTCFTCPQGWLLFNSKCYFFSTDKFNWNNSQKNCTLLGGHLVIIESNKEQNFLTALVEIEGEEEKTYWIGLTDQVNENQFLWVDNKPLDIKNEFWGRRENDNGLEPDNWTHRKNGYMGEDCVELKKLERYSGWYDQNCVSEKKRICEAAALTLPTHV